MHQPIDENNGMVHLEEDSVEYTYSDIYKMITVHESIILHINATDIEKVKKGLANAKMRERRRNKEAGFEDADERLEFAELRPNKGETLAPGSIKLQASLIPPKAVPIHKVVLPSEEM